MRRALTFLAVCAVVMLAETGAAPALDVNTSPFYVISDGNNSCGQFLSGDYDVTQTANLEWILGYISGRNREAADMKERMLGHGLGDIDADFVWLRHYCAEHPFTPLVSAADALRAATER